MTNETQQVKISAGHTPGPWVARKRDQPFGVTEIWTEGVVDSQFVLALVYKSQDAPLVAAAPRMAYALEAIRARIRGEFDNPLLVAFGPLGDMNEDIIEMVNRALPWA